MMADDIAILFKEKNKSILLNTLHYDIEKNRTSVLESMVNIFNHEFDTAITKIISIYQDADAKNSEKFITDTINRMKLDSYKEMELLLNIKRSSLEERLEKVTFDDVGFQSYYDAIVDTTNVFKDSFRKYCVDNIQKEALSKFRKNIKKNVEKEKQELILARVEDYFMYRLYGKLENKIYMELDLRDNNLLNKGKEGYLRYQEIVSKTEEND